MANSRIYQVYIEIFISKTRSMHKHFSIERRFCADIEILVCFTLALSLVHCDSYIQCTLYTFTIQLNPCKDFSHEYQKIWQRRETDCRSWIYVSKKWKERLSYQRTTRITYVSVERVFQCIRNISCYRFSSWVEQPSESYCMIEWMKLYVHNQFSFLAIKTLFCSSVFIENQSDKIPINENSFCD